MLRCVEGLVIRENTHKKEEKTRIMLDKRVVGVPVYTLIWQRFKKELPGAIITGAS